MSLWSADEAARATGGQARGGAWRARGVSIDSRTLRPGDLFVALTAARDGHDFVAGALERGAAAAMVSRRPPGVGPEAPLLVVDRVQAGLEALGRAGRARARARVVAVTGSAGKTSTKEMLRQALARQGRVHAAEASYNNQWGVPLTLARMPPESDFAVIEIGMNHPGEIAPLARLARPHVALITIVAPAHLEAFGSLAAIAREKAAILAGLEPDGVAVINGDLAVSDILREAAGEAARAGRCLSFGAGRDNAYRLEGLRLADGVTTAQLVAPAARHLLRLDASGRHFAMNALGVLAAVEALGADGTLAVRDLARWQPPAGRGRRRKVVLDPVGGQYFTLIDDAYNANPASVAAALEVLAAASPGRAGRRIAILGDMLELGREEAALHAGLADLEPIAAVDRVHCSGPRMRALWERLEGERQGEWVAQAAELAARLPGLVGPGDVVLVKGSLGAGLGQVVDGLVNLGQTPGQTARGPD